LTPQHATARPAAVSQALDKRFVAQKGEASRVVLVNI